MIFSLLLQKLLPKQIWFAIALVGLIEPSFPVLAQVIPDGTLGSQSSTVNTSGAIDTVHGGVRSGANLFHSFLELNVDRGRSLYFSDPGVSNILTRVTGSNPSNINGRLGVSGTANLFLINPNGIVFGAGSTLDIRGSFTATTAAGIKFADGSEFNAINPASSNLLTIAVPIGLQRGGNQPTATIINRGNLQVGQDLTLEADRLDLQGTLETGRDLTLLAADTVKVRDTTTEPFLAKAGGNLTVQGDRGIDILALNHPTQTPFVSGGTLSLISDGVISGDARFASTGNFQVRSRSGGLATFTSLYDPIITTAGDVNLALNYTGASLLIEAGGNIRIQGTVDITAPDVAAPFVGDDVVLNSQPGLILRSGQANRRYAVNSGAVAGSTTGLGIVPLSGITLQGDVAIAPDGIINLTADGNGSISTQAIIAPRGAIAMTSAQSITTNGQPMNVGTDSGDAGSIRLTTLNGNLFTGDLVANVESFTGDVGNGGVVSLSSINGSITTGQLQTGAYSFANSGNGGTLTFSVTNGSITTGDIENSLFGYDTAGNGGTLTFSTTNGSTTTGNINNTLQLAGLGTIGNGGTVTLAGNNGTITTGIINTGLTGIGTNATSPAITITTTNGAIATGDLSAASRDFYSTAINGGTITLTSNQGDITTGDLVSGSFGGLGGRTGGAILVTAENGNITTNRLFADAGGFEQNPLGNGGAIVLASPKGTITTTDLSASSSTLSFDNSSRTGNAGSITLTAAGNLETGSISTLALAYVRDPVALGSAVPPDAYGFTLAGNGGAIALTSTDGSIQTGNLLSFSTAALDQGFYLGLPEDFDGFNRALRTTGSAGGDIRLNAAQNIATGLISTIGNTGSGNITLTAGNAFTGSTIISSDTFGSGRAGDIQITARSLTLNNGGQLSASVHRSGSGGTIAIAADSLEVSGTTTQPPKADLLIQTPTGLTVLSNVYLGGYVPTGDLANLAPGGAFPSGIFAQTTQGSTGNAGNIAIQARQLNLNDQGTIGTTTFGSGSAGNIMIQAHSIRADNGSIFSGVAPGASGNSGAIAISAQSLNLVNQGRIQALTLGSGRAGDIDIQTETTTIAGNLSGIISGSGTPDQRGGTIGNGGNIQIATRSLQVKDEGIVSASTFTRGQGGNINVTASEVELSRQGKLSATTQDRGNAGNITVNASDRVTITGDQSGIFANSTPQAIGNGGSVFLVSDQLLLQDKARITVGTQGQGQGGDIQIVANQINLDTQSLITAETSGSGKGGNLNLSANRLTIQNGAAASVSGQGSGSGGNLTATANSLTLDNRGKLIAETTSSDGGNINLNVRDILLLRRNSLISASAGTAQSGGDGGNVTIKAGFVIGVLNENSDIRANAFTGSGGRVNITAQGIFGLKFQSKLTPFSDITASSQFGTSGTVTLNTLNVDPNRGLVQLPSTFADSTHQIAQTCSTQKIGNSFIVTGRGGISPDPTEALSQTPVWTEGKGVSGERSERVNESKGAHSTVRTHSVVEATRLSRSADGSISLVAEGEVAQNSAAVAALNCQTDLLGR